MHLQDQYVRNTIRGWEIADWSPTPLRVFDDGSPETYHAVVRLVEQLAPHNDPTHGYGLQNYWLTPPGGLTHRKWSGSLHMLSLGPQIKVKLHQGKWAVFLGEDEELGDVFDEVVVQKWLAAPLL